MYPKELCCAVLRGVTEQLKEDGLLKDDGGFGVQLANGENEIEASCKGPEQGFSGRYHEDLTVQILKDEMVTQERLSELDFSNNKGRLDQRPIGRGAKVDGPPPPYRQAGSISTKALTRTQTTDGGWWPTQMKAKDTSGMSYFAPAPPLEALSTVISLAVTQIGIHADP